jgi:hypothetical protein
MPRLEGWRFGRLVVNGEVPMRDVIMLPERVVTTWRLADVQRLVLDNREAVRDGLPEHLVVGTGFLRADAPRSGRRASPPYGGGAAPGVATGLVVMSSPSGANTARSTLAIAYGTLSADQKPRSVSGDSTPPSTRNRIPSGAASNRNRPAQRTPALEQGSAQQHRSNYQDQECNQEDRVANVALDSANGDGIELDPVPQGHCRERECRNNDSGHSQSAQPVTA